MANMRISDHICRTVPGVCISSRRLNATKPTGLSLSPTHKFSKAGNLAFKADKKFKWVVRLSLVEESPPKSTVDANRLVDFLYEDLPHLFDDQGIDRTAYDERVKFRDPITKHDTISGYLFNIALLKKFFRPNFQLHWVKQDYWDSIRNNNYFSLEGLSDVINQLRIYKTPDLESPKYQILKRTANYEVRKYSPFVVVETDGDKLSGSTGFNAVAGYIFGKNSTKEKIPMTTPVFTQTFDTESSKVSIHIVISPEKEMSSLPDPSEEAINLRKVEEGIAAVSKFSGKPTEEVVREKEKVLRANLIRDGLGPKSGCLLARYNDPGSTWSFMMVLFTKESFIPSHFNIKSNLSKHRTYNSFRR